METPSRVGETRYAYASDMGFSTQLEVEAAGFVTEYPPLWSAAWSG